MWLCSPAPIILLILKFYVDCGLMRIPLVLVSGLLSNSSLWQHQMRHLSEIASIQTISPSQNTPEKMIQAILDEAPPIFALAGHSMGGWLCLELMRTAFGVLH